MAVSPKNMRLAVTIDRDTATKIEEMAKKDRRSVSSMLLILIIEALQQREE